MRLLTRLAIVAAALAALPACSGGGGGDDDDDSEYVETGRVEITLLLPPATPAGQDPFDGVVAYHIAILNSAGTVLVEEDFDASDPLEIRSLDPGDDRVVVFEGRDAVGTPLSRGRTLPLDIVEGSTPVEASLYFSKVGAFATVYGAPAARTGATTWTFSDGRVLIAGGLDGGGAPLATAELFDWVNDTVITAGTMSSGGTAFSVAASLGPDTLLIAGGVTDVAGTPTDLANVYTHVPGGVGAWAGGVPVLPAPRRELGGAELGTGRAMVAGGSATTAATGPALDTTFLFEWNGAIGAWSAGPAMNEPRMGALVLAASGDVAIVVGGYNNNVSGGNDDFSDDGDVFNWTGSALELAPGPGPQIGASRGWSGVLEVTANQWLVWGGEEGDNSTHDLLDLVELWTWNGTSITADSRQSLPTPQRGGTAGLLTGNQILLLGGSTGEYPANTPTSTAAIYDVAGDTFTNLSPSPGATLGGTAAPLPDGTSLVVIDGAVLRFNPL